MLFLSRCVIKSFSICIKINLVKYFICSCTKHLLLLFKSICLLSKTHISNYILFDLSNIKIQLKSFLKHTNSIWILSINKNKHTPNPILLKFINISRRIKHERNPNWKSFSKLLFRIYTTRQTEHCFFAMFSCK